MKLDPAQVLELAEQSWKPLRRFVLFSGGNDSATLLHWAWHNTPIPIDAAVHINTGIGVTQTRDFVRSFCADYGIPLIEQCAPRGEYERLCREYGVPGPGAHWQAYRYLKDRQVESLVADQRGSAKSPIMLITGVRRDESRRRMGTTLPIKLRKGQLWVAPFVDWSNADLRAYREKQNVPRNEVADVMHMSMECACGAFGSREELQLLKVFYPEVALQIERAEQIAKDAGQKHCEWGRARNNNARQRDMSRFVEMDLCSNCTGSAIAAGERVA